MVSPGTPEILGTGGESDRRVSGGEFAGGAADVGGGEESCARAPNTIVETIRTTPSTRRRFIPPWIRAGCDLLHAMTFVKESGVGLAAGFVFAAGCRAIGLIDENVIVARGADHSINGFAELFVRSLCGVFGARFFPRHAHGRGSFIAAVSIPASW
ncbi:MAG: hypothetical protein ACREQC_16930 [Candidatus Binataceae bacterium]